MDDDFVIDWGEAEAVAPRVLTRDAFGITNGAGLPPPPTSFPASIAFDDAVVDLQGKHQPLYATWVGTVRIPLHLPSSPAEVWFKNDLRFNIDKDSGTRVLIVADLEGHTFVGEFGFEDDEEQSAPATDKGKNAPDISSHEITEEFISKAASLPIRSYTLNLFLAVERRTTENVGRVSINSLDIIINPNLQTGRSNTE